MRKNMLKVLLVGILVIGLAGCGNQNQVESNSNSNENNNNTSSVLNSVSSISTEYELENIEYRLERVNGDYLFFLKNNNTSTVNLTITIEFYKNNQFVFRKSEVLNFFRPNGVGVRNIEDYSYDYDDYKITFEVEENNDYEDYSKYITFEEEIVNDELKINVINSSSEDVGVFAYVIYYKDNEIVAYDYGSSTSKKQYIISSYPKDENKNKIEFDRYEIYLDSAHI